MRAFDYMYVYLEWICDGADSNSFLAGGEWNLNTHFQKIHIKGVVDQTDEKTKKFPIVYSAVLVDLTFVQLVIHLISCTVLYFVGCLSVTVVVGHRVHQCLIYLR